MRLFESTPQLIQRHLRRFSVVLIFATVILVCVSLKSLSQISPYPIDTILSFTCGALYFITFGLWGYYRSRNVVFPTTRRLLTVIVLLMMFWVAVRIVKYDFANDLLSQRYLWYCYYLPICLIPACSLLTLASTSRKEWQHFRHLAIGLMAIAISLFLIVITNDFHELVFDFSQSNPPNSSYQHGPLWIVLTVFAVVCIVGSIALVFHRSSVPQSKTLLWLPFLPLLAGLVYVLCYPNLHHPDMTMFFCALTLFEFEALIVSGLLHVNQNYWELFRHTSLCAAITNNDGDVVFATNQARPLLRDPRDQTEHYPAPSSRLIKPFTSLEEGLQVRTIPIKNGYFIWVEDNREELCKRRELEEHKKELTSLQELLRKQIALEEEQQLVAVRSRLYDRLSQELTDEFTRITLLTEDRPAYEECTLQTLATLTVIGAYIKRRSNLIILEEQQLPSSIDELYFCLKESCGCLTECGIPSSVIKCSLNNNDTFFEKEDELRSSDAAPLPLHSPQTNHNEGNFAFRPAPNSSMDITHVEALYDLFENIVEYLLPTLEALLVHLDTTENKVSLLLQVEASFDAQVKIALDKDPALPLSLWGNAAVYRTLEKYGGSISSSFEDKVWNLHIGIPRFHEGGES